MRVVPLRHLWVLQFLPDVVRQRKARASGLFAKPLDLGLEHDDTDRGGGHGVLSFGVSARCRRALVGAVSGSTLSQAYRRPIPG